MKRPPVLKDEDPADGEVCYYAVASIPTGNWSLILRVSEASIMGPIWQQLVQRVAIGRIDSLARDYRVVALHLGGIQPADQSCRADCGADCGKGI